MRKNNALEKLAARQDDGNRLLPRPEVLAYGSKPPDLGLKIFEYAD
jgi:hypothetical protein